MALLASLVPFMISSHYIASHHIPSHHITSPHDATTYHIVLYHIHHITLRCYRTLWVVSVSCCDISREPTGYFPEVVDESCASLVQLWEGQTLDTFRRPLFGDQNGATWSQDGPTMTEE